MAGRRSSAPGEPANLLRRVDAEHIARHDPARVLRAVEADRGLVDILEQAVEAWYRERATAAIPSERHSRSSALAERALRLLARPHADHPDYRPDWAPWWL